MNSKEISIVSYHGEWNIQNLITNYLDNSNKFEIWKVWHAQCCYLCYYHKYDTLFYMLPISGNSDLLYPVSMNGHSEVVIPVKLNIQKLLSCFISLMIENILMHDIGLYVYYQQHFFRTILWNMGILWLLSQYFNEYIFIS